MTTWGAGLAEETIEERIEEVERRTRLLALCITDILDHLNRHSDTDAQQKESLDTPQPA